LNNLLLKNREFKAFKSRSRVESRLHGFFKILLSKLGLNARIIGIDISHNYLRILKQENELIYDDLLQADASYLPFNTKNI
jgi:ubiquinone/menaquinone biosynthesis C-methylase UbiE